MTGNETYAEDASGHTAPPRVGGSGRITVLPRVEIDEGSVRLVQEERQRFETVRLLGEGGMGRVELVRDLDIGREVAVKRLRPGMRSTSAISRFVTEVRTVGRLDHPNIVPIHDVGRDEDGGLHFVMKYVEGETLEQVIQRLAAGDPETHRVWTFSRRIEVFLGVLRALQYAHAQGVVHRDLKPANVLVGRFGEVMLSDFGIARQLSAPELVGDAETAGQTGGTTRVGTVIGSPLYMSPEQARGDHHLVDARSDLYSAGVLFAELITLVHPLAGLPDGEAIRKAVVERELQVGLSFHPAQGYPPAELLYFVGRATEKDPSKRPASAAAMIDDLRATAAGRYQMECHLTMTKGLLEQCIAAIDRRPFLAAVGLIGAASAALAGVGGWISTAVLLSGG